MVTGLLFGLAPALRLSHGSVSSTLRDGARGATGGSLARVRGALVLGEVAVALMLLVGAGLLIRSFDKLNRVDLGFEPVERADVHRDLPGRQVHGARPAAPVYRVACSSAPAVAARRPRRGAEHDLPMGGAGYLTYHGRRAAARESRPGDPARTTCSRSPCRPTTSPRCTSRCKRGRLFTPTDRERATPWRVVERRGGAALPSMTAVDPDRADASPSATRATRHVVDDHRRRGRQHRAGRGDGEAVCPALSIHRTVRPERACSSRCASIAIPVSCRVGCAAVRDVDRDLVVNEIQPLEARVANNIARPRVQRVAPHGGFSVVALLLAAIGIYGVMAYTVSQRTREIGVRMALGADPGNVKRLVVLQGMRPRWSASWSGLIAALAASRLIASLLYDVSALDPVTFVLVPLFLMRRRARRDVSAGAARHSRAAHGRAAEPSDSPPRCGEHGSHASRSRSSCSARHLVAAGEARPLAAAQGAPGTPAVRSHDFRSTTRSRSPSRTIRSHLTVVDQPRRRELEEAERVRRLHPERHAGFGSQYREGLQQLIAGQRFGAPSDQISSTYDIGVQAQYNATTLIAPKVERANLRAADAAIVELDSSVFARGDAAVSQRAPAARPCGDAGHPARRGARAAHPRAGARGRAP